MDTLISILGIIAAAIISLVYYLRKRKAFASLLWLAVLSIGLGTPLLYFIMPPATAAVANKWIYQRMKRNWSAFLLSLAGIFPVAALLIGAIPYYIPSGANAAGLGALVAGVGMIIIYAYFIIAGIILYFLSTFTYSFVRWAGKKHE